MRLTAVWDSLSVPAIERVDPWGGIRRGLLQRFGGDRLHLGISDPPGRLRSGRIGQAGEVIGDKL